MLAPNYALECSIVNYLVNQTFVSGSNLSGSNLSFYQGINNSDKDMMPSVIVSANEGREIDPFTRNYEFQVRVIVQEIAADTNGLGVNAQAVFNEFQNSTSASANFTNQNFNIGIWRVMNPTITTEVDGDALQNMLEVKMYGALIPSGSSQ